MNKSVLKKTILPAIMFCMLSLGFAATAQPAYAQNVDENLCGGSGFKLSTDGKCKQRLDEGTGTGEGRIQGTIRRVVNLLSIAVGIVAVVMIIIGGIRFATSGGDSGSISGAKNTIIYALVGLIIVALAQAIVRFVIGQTT